MRLTSLASTRRMGMQLAAVLPPQALVLLEGSLGSGKTTLCKAICEGWGVAPQTVNSPTYTFVHVYPLHQGSAAQLDPGSPRSATLGAATPAASHPEAPTPEAATPRDCIYHVDFFRLVECATPLEMEPQEWLNATGPTLIEWPAPALPWLQRLPRLELSLRTVGLRTRSLSAQAPLGGYAEACQLLQSARRSLKTHL